MRILLLCLLFPFAAQAQTGGRAWGAFNRAVTVNDGWKGHPYRLLARVKPQGADESSWAGIWLRAHAAGGAISFFDNMQDRPLKENKWTDCEIKSVFKEQDSIIYFGGLYIGPGRYAFDSFSLQVETSAGNWETVPLPGMALKDTTALSAWSMPGKGRGLAHSFDNGHLVIDARSLPVEKKEERSIYGNNPKAGHYANVNGIKVYYEVYGKGEPVVLLHGNSQAIIVFTYLIPELSKKYKVIAVDTRLQGKSGDDGKHLTYELFAEDVKALLDHLKLKKVHLFGWSDGGNTGLILASKYPDRFKTLMTMGANLQPDTNAVKPFVIAQLKTEVAKLKPEATVNKRLWTLCLEEPHISPEQLKAIKCPTLVMAGDDDMIKDEHTRFIAATIPKGELLIFEKATHFAPFDVPEKFRQALEDFLAKHK
ncbi:hypothetical protein DLD77_06795 [Chitinophaga alhagiae]|uniref:AB hydrolase-1 domain-containing protein n=1 Tax=Chitinophaga alhagiae TaxID=2203219 RepID=A0ABN5LQP5_9BACT|nr:alpha/beta hydrolase [Chitinophaga alhagiae]AWO01419.1 hypothetical protein DLD77_06795 [Chitinophaga alhagiae]